MKEYKFDSSTMKLDEFPKELETFLLLNKVNPVVVSHLLSTSEEIIYRITSYGKKKRSLINVKVFIDDEAVTMTFIDNNYENDILDKSSAENKLSLKAIKKNIDEFSYFYEDGSNKIIIKKEI